MSLEGLIQKELELLDLNLFLDKEIEHGSVIYKVKLAATLNEPPYEVLSWDVGGYPLPLSLDLVARVRAQEGDIREAIQTITVNNAVKRAKIQSEVDDIAETISKEFEKSSKRLHISGPWASRFDVTAYKN